MADFSNDSEDACISKFFVEIPLTSANLTTSDSAEAYDKISGQDQGAMTLHSNSNLETDLDVGSSEAVTSFQDGQEVQLDDGTTAFIFHNPKEGYPPELSQPVQLNNGDTAYIYRPCPSDSQQLVEAKGASDDVAETNVFCVGLSTEVEIKDTKFRPLQVYQCDEEDCKKVYSKPHHLKVHKRKHTGEKPYQCEYETCKKFFSTSYALKLHLRVHTGEKPFPCPQDSCSKAFKSAGDLQKHIRTHTGEKPFKCPFEGCGKAFTTSNICKVHVRTHTGERPYKCPFPGCKKDFTNITNYKNHLRIHTGEKPYVCLVRNCGKQFTEYSSLYKHQIVHSGEKPYTCPYCGKAYRQASTLLSHKRKMHDDHRGVSDEDFLMMGKTRNSPGESQTTIRKAAKLISDQSDVLMVPMETMSSSYLAVKEDQASSQTDNPQIQMALEIDGTKYLLQVVTATDKDEDPSPNYVVQTASASSGISDSPEKAAPSNIKGTASPNISPSKDYTTYLVTPIQLPQGEQGNASAVQHPVNESNSLAVTASDKTTNSNEPNSPAVTASDKTTNSNEPNSPAVTASDKTTPVAQNFAVPSKKTKVLSSRMKPKPILPCGKHRITVKLPVKSTLLLSKLDQS